MIVCSVEGCETRTRANGLCNKHNMRMRVTGTTDPGYKAHAEPSVRFFRKVEKTDTCWNWQGGTRPNGYGHFQVGGTGGKVMSAHRFSYEYHKGEIPEGAVIMHSCDRPICVNPDHLTAGTYKENMADMWAKGRGNPARNIGEASGKSKLTEKRVRFIRSHPEMGHKEIADLWGLSPNAVRGVRIGRTWTHVK